MDKLRIENKKMFTDTGSNNELAHIKKENMSAQFYYYTVGYHNAAKVLIEHTLNKMTEDHTEFFKEEELRLCVIPACFLYRQYLELTLKDIYIQFSDDENNLKKKITNTHDLKIIWEHAKPQIERAIIGRNINNEQFVNVESYILEFASEDKTSFKYRYPITKTLELIFTQECKINIRNLMECMDEIEEFFASGIISWLEMDKLFRKHKEDINKGLEFSEQNKHHEALKYFNEALIWEKQWSEEHPGIFFTSYAMAESYCKIDDFDKSLHFYLQCASLYEKTKQKIDIPITLDSVYNLIGMIYKIQKKYDKALEYYNKPLENSTVTDIDKNDSYTGLARIYYNINYKAKAKVYYEKAMNLRINIFGEGHESTVFLQDEINEKILNIICPKPKT